VLRIRIRFNADPDAAFYINSDPDPGSQTDAGPGGSGSWSDFVVHKKLDLDFGMKNILYVANMSQF
jgi:hypothetical protein